MLPRAHRLRHSADFDQAVRRGARAGSGVVVLHGWVRDDDDPSRVGFVVTKAVGDAVARNRVRRRLRHLLSARLDLLPAHSSVVVRVLPSATAARSTLLGAELDTALATLRSRCRPTGQVAAPTLRRLV